MSVDGPGRTQLTPPAFLGEAEGRLLPDGRSFMLTVPFSFRCSRGVIWTAPAGVVVDGSSIPHILQGPLIGGPWEGKHRRASIIHDYNCQMKIATSREAARVYYEGCIVDGFDPVHARGYYLGIRIAGPQWEMGSKRPSLMQALAEFAEDALDPVFSENIPGCGSGMVQ